jgi:hypothetical protein
MGHLLAVRPVFVNSGGKSAASPARPMAGRIVERVAGLTA